MINKMITAVLPLMPKSIVHVFAKKYIAGEQLEDAVETTRSFEALGGKTTIDVLGEFVTDKNAANHEKDMCLQVIEAVDKHKLPTYLSIKPTSVGLGIDYNFGFANIKELVDKAKELGVFVRLDMENSPYTDDTLKAYKELRDMGYDNVGFVIQAYMKRSYDDLVSLKEYQPNVRLCKGIYNESPEIAYKDFHQIRDNYKKLFHYMADNDFFIGIATHDDYLVEFAESEIKRRNMTEQNYEFQMLLGVKEKIRNELLTKGHNVRIYVPYGEDWYGYSIRRLKENPKMAGHIAKSIFSFNS